MLVFFYSMAALSLAGAIYFWVTADLVSAGPFLFWAFIFTLLAISPPRFRKILGVMVLLIVVGGVALYLTTIPSNFSPR